MGCDTKVWLQQSCRDGHRTVTDTAVDQTVTNGHGCSRNRTVGVQSAIGTVPTDTYTVVTAVFTAVYQVNSNDMIISI